MPRLFVFEAVWRLPADPDTVYRALAASEDYHRWWPQIVESARLDHESGRLTAKSALPYRLRMVVRREIEDAATRNLRAALTGDLDGWSSWRVVPDGPGSLAVYDQQVVVSARFLGLLAQLAPWPLRWNHQVMMRDGERGLRRYLAATATPGAGEPR